MSGFWAKIQPNSRCHAFCNQMKSGEIRCNSPCPTNPIPNEESTVWPTFHFRKKGYEFFAEHWSDRLLPIPANQKCNDYLKEIAAICGIEKRLTFHLARHTFATTVTLTNGVPIFDSRQGTYRLYLLHQEALLGYQKGLHNSWRLRSHSFGPLSDSDRIQNAEEIAFLTRNNQ